MPQLTTVLVNGHLRQVHVTERQEPARWQARLVAWLLRRPKPEPVTYVRFG